MRIFFPVPRWTLCLALLFSTVNKSLAQPDTALIGAYVMDIYDIDLTQNSFSAQFWVWFNYKMGSEIQPMQNLELPNAKSQEASDILPDEKNGLAWDSRKFTAVLKKEWNTQNFPFDKQKMTIEFEESDKDVSTLIYQADTKNTSLAPNLKLASWEIESFEMRAGTKHYNSTFGDPELSEGSTYAHAELNIFIKRHSWGLFFSLFTGMYVAFFISCLVFFIDPHHVDPRFGLSVGGLFAAVGNKYIVDSELPPSAGFTLVDKLHSLTFAFLLLCIILSVISLRLWSDGKKAQSKKFDAWAFRLIFTTYCLVNAVLIWRAASGR